MNRSHIRYWIVLGVLASFFVYIFSRYIVLASRSPDPAPVVQKAVVRGNIFDRYGRILAIDAEKYSIAGRASLIDPKKYEAEAPELAKIFSMTTNEVLLAYNKRKTDFFYINKRTAPEEAEVFFAEQKAGKFVGLQAEKVVGRFYPEGHLASHLLGFVGADNVGLAGIEQKYNSDLQATVNDTATVENSGLSLRGLDVVLTIDSAIQYELEKIANRTKEANGAEAVILLAADAKTGELLAYAAAPDFDPNSFAESSSEERLDWPSVYVYEPGSVFKVFSLASIMDLGGITPDTIIDCTVNYIRKTTNGDIVKIGELKGAHYGPQTVSGILKLSSNVGAAYASDRVGEYDFYNKLVALGFGGRVNSTQTARGSTLLAIPDEWTAWSKPTIAIGQTINVTAMQIIGAAATLANGGFARQPITVKKLLDNNGVSVYENVLKNDERVLSQNTSKAILAAMERDTEADATGYRGRIADLRISLKTGTAQMLNETRSKYSDTDYIASTIGIFPVNDPQVIVYLAIIKPRGPSNLGGVIAAPVVREAIEAILGVSDTPRGDSVTVKHPDTVRIDLPPPLVIGKLMPDARGLPKKFLLPLLNRADLVVSISGDGYVVEQYPPAGTKITDGMKLSFILR